MLWAPSLLSKYIPIIKCSCILDNFCVIRTSIWFITVLFKCLTTAENLKGTKIWINYLCCMISKLPLSTHTCLCACMHDMQALHIPTQPPPHTQKSCLHLHQSMWGNSPNPWNLRRQLRLLDDDPTNSKARLMCQKKECEPGMCLNTDMASGEPTAMKTAGVSWGGLC